MSLSFQMEQIENQYSMSLYLDVGMVTSKYLKIEYSEGKTRSSPAPLSCLFLTEIVRIESMDDKIVY